MSIVHGFTAARDWKAFHHGCFDARTSWSFDFSGSDGNAMSHGIAMHGTYDPLLVGLSLMIAGSRR